MLPEKHPLLESDFVGELWYIYVSIIVGGQLVCVYSVSICMFKKERVWKSKDRTEKNKERKKAFPYCLVMVILCCVLNMNLIF